MIDLDQAWSSMAWRALSRRRNGLRCLEARLRAGREPTGAGGAQGTASAPAHHRASRRRGCLAVAAVGGRGERGRSSSPPRPDGRRGCHRGCRSRPALFSVRGRKKTRSSRSLPPFGGSRPSVVLRFSGRVTTLRTRHFFLATPAEEGQALTLRERLARAAGALQRRGGTLSVDAARIQRLAAGWDRPWARSGP